MNEKNYTWKDLICVNGQVYAEEFPVDCPNENEPANCDNFLEHVRKKYNTDEFKTYTFDGEEFAPSDYDKSKLPYGAEACGLYINGVAEWLIEDNKNNNNTVQSQNI